MKRYFAIAGCALFLGGCEPKPNTADLVKSMVVTTDYDNTVDFTKYSSYYLPMDTVSYFNSSDNYASDTLQCSACTGYNNQLGTYPTVITSELKGKLDLAGYSQVGKRQS